MKMKRGKIISIAMALVMSIGALTISPAYAVDESTAYANYEAEEQASLKKALAKVKKRITIPKEVSEFSYEYGQNYEGDIFRFKWVTPDDYDGERITIEVHINGDIITYYDYEQRNNYYYSSTPKFSKYNETELLKKAKAIVKKINPKIYSLCEFKTDGVSLYRETARINISRKANGLYVSNNTGYITLNKNTGEMDAFSLSWWDNAEFASKDTALSKKEAFNAYKSLNSFDTYYIIDTDYETGKKSANIIYESSYTGLNDASTGKSTTMYNDKYGKSDYGDSYYGDESLDVSTSVDCEDADFTEAELKAITKNENMLDKEKIRKLLEDNEFINITDDMSLSSSRLNEVIDRYTKISTFYWTVEYSNYKTIPYQDLKVNLNAETGEIINFNLYARKYDDIVAPVLDVEKANTIAENAMKYYLPKISNKFKAAEGNLSKVLYWGENNKYYDTSRTFKFYRYENGIYVVGEYISITVNSDNIVTDFNYCYTDNVKFAKPTLVSFEEVNKEIYKHFTMDLYYTGYIDYNGVTHTYLVFNQDGYYINANTGKLCNHYGTENITSTSTNDAVVDTNYTDIKGISAEKAIKELALHNITLETKNGKFEPNKIITEEEFTKLCSTVLDNSNAYYDFRKNNKNDDGTYNNKNLTRTKACRYLVISFGLQESAELKGIFKSPYSDVSEKSDYVGYVAICYAKGLIKPNSAKKFYPTKNMTRAEAMKLFYDYIIELNKQS